MPPPGRRHARDRRADRHGVRDETRGAQCHVSGVSPGQATRRDARGDESTPRESFPTRIRSLTAPRLSHRAFPAFPQSIETLSHWCVFHRKRAKTLAPVWQKELRAAPGKRKLSFLYLANDVLQNSRKKGSEWIEALWPKMEWAVKHTLRATSDEKTAKSCAKLVKVWLDRRIFGSRSLEGWLDASAGDDVSLVRETHLRRGIEPLELRGEGCSDMFAGFGHVGGPEVARRRALQSDGRASLGANVGSFPSGTKMAIISGEVPRIPYRGHCCQRGGSEARPFVGIAVDHVLRPWQPTASNDGV